MKACLLLRVLKKKCWMYRYSFLILFVSQMFCYCFFVFPIFCYFFCVRVYVRNGNRCLTSSFILASFHYHSACSRNTKFRKSSERSRNMAYWHWNEPKWQVEARHEFSFQTWRTHNKKIEKDTKHEKTICIFHLFKKF